MTQTLDFIIINLLTILILIAAVFVICSKILIYSIFSLIAVFAVGIWFFIYSEAEYIMLLFLIVYLGAVLVFFLSVLTLSDKKYWVIHSDFPESKITLFFCKLFFFIVASILIYALNLSISKFNFKEKYCNTILLYSDKLQLSDVEEIGLLLYSDCILLLVIGGVVLLVAPIGCVVLITPYTKKS